MLLQAEIIGSLISVPIENVSLKINHLFLADDNLLFCKGSSIEWCNLLSLLKEYEKAFG